MKVYGPYTRADGRKHVILYDPVTKSRRTKSYPKYLMEQHLGKELTEDETVDHIDADFTNDDLNNLQILSRSANAKKSSYSNGSFYKCSNPKCENSFWRSQSQVEKNQFGVFCSNSCKSITFGNQYQINARVAQLVEASDLSSDQ